MSNDLVTFGETMLRLSPPDGKRIELATELDFQTAGAESNVAITATRLGVPSAWLSKLPDSPLGRKVTTSLRQHGVATDVTWTDEGRQGTYYLEFGTKPRGTNVIYDRADAAVTTATTDDIALDRVRNADVFYTSGITPALSGTLESTTRETFAAALEAGTTTAFDLNYRSKLWTESEAKATYESLLPLVDVLVAAERDARAVLGAEGSAEDVARALRETHDHETVVVTRGENGALARTEEGTIQRAAYETETVDPIGTGDAFVGGFLARRIAGYGVEDALDFGAATAALKRTMVGDVAVVTPEEVEAVRAGEDPTIDR